MIFVTGGTGMLGAHLLFHLTQKHCVTALCRSLKSVDSVRKIFSFYTDTPDIFLSKIKWVEGDVTDYFQLKKLMANAEIVYHAAATVSFDPADKKKVLFNNVQGTENVVNCCLDAKVAKLCHVSSIATLTSPEPGDIITEAVVSPTVDNVTAYSYSKILAEFEVWRGINEGLNAVIVNPSVIIGPGDWAKSSSALFKLVAEGLKYYTDGQTGFVGVNDVCKAMILLTESTISNERFLLNSENLRYKELFNMIADNLKVKRPSKKASRLLTETAWRAEKIRSFLLCKKPQITRETACSAHNVSEYSNQKITQTFNFRFTPISTIIKETAALYNSDHK